jgi:hypothetical protein
VPSNRELSKSQICVNLYIRYKRDFERDPAWAGIKPYIHHEKLPFEIFKTHEVIANLHKNPNLLRATEEAIKIETDGRKKKTLNKEFHRLKTLQARHYDVSQDIKLGVSPIASSIGIERIIEWSRIQKKEVNLLINNHGYVSIKGIDVDAQELNTFIYDFQETFSVFKINNPFNNPILVFELMKGHWSFGHNQEEGYAIEESLEKWRTFCTTADNILGRLKEISYFKQGKDVLFEFLERKQSEHINEYNLLKMVIDYEKKSTKQVQLTPKSIQEIRLITLLNEFYPAETIKKLFKNIFKIN